MSITMQVKMKYSNRCPQESIAPAREKICFPNLLERSQKADEVTGGFTAFSILFCLPPPNPFNPLRFFHCILNMENTWDRPSPPLKQQYKNSNSFGEGKIKHLSIVLLY